MNHASRTLRTSSTNRFIGSTVWNTTALDFIKTHWYEVPPRRNDDAIHHARKTLFVPAPYTNGTLLFVPRRHGHERWTHQQLLRKLQPRATMSVSERCSSTDHSCDLHRAKNAPGRDKTQLAQRSWRCCSTSFKTVIIF